MIKIIGKKPFHKSKQVPQVLIDDRLTYPEIVSLLVFRNSHRMNEDDIHFQLPISQAKVLIADSIQVAKAKVGVINKELDNAEELLKKLQD